MPGENPNQPDMPPKTARREGTSRRLLAEHAIYVLQLVARLREQALDAELAAIGLTANRLRVLSLVRRMKTSTMGELAFLSGIDRTTLTRTVDQLTEAELVARQDAPRDRRKVALALTPKGERLHRKSISAVTAANQAVFGSVSDERLRETIRVLTDAIADLVTDPRERETLLSLARRSRAEVE